MGTTPRPVRISDGAGARHGSCELLIAAAPSIVDDRATAMAHSSKAARRHAPLAHGNCNRSPAVA
jgi:hypothetical protein